MPRMSINLEGLDRCPQCGIAKPLLQYRHYVFGEKASDGDVYFIWLIYQCSSCKELICGKGVTSSKGWDSSALLFLGSRDIVPFKLLPSEIGLDGDLPERPRTYLKQALDSRFAPDGAIMLAGSAIDAMLKAKGLGEGSLFSRIEQAAASGIITENMKDWAHAIRLESNKPRHADVDDPHATLQEADQAIEFARALGDFLFVFPARVARGRAVSETLA